MNRPFLTARVAFGRASALAAVAVAVACNHGGDATQGKGVRPVPVVVAPVVQKDVPEEIQAVGTAEAVAMVEVMPQVSGLVQEVHFKEGDFVKKGALLFTIDTRPYQATLTAARAELEKNRALAQAARGDLERAETLAREGLLSQVDLTQKRASAAALEATLGANQAAIVGSSINVQFAALRAPIDGRTGSVLVHAGNVVKPADARPLVVIRTLEPIHVRFAVPEQFLGPIRARWKESAEGVPVLARPRGTSEGPAVGRLTFIENTVDAATGKIELKALFPNEGQALWPGQFVDVTVQLGTEAGAVVVPETAIQTGQEGAYTFVVGDDLQATLRPVVVKRTLRGEAIIGKGLAVGERVVVDGQVRIRSGSKVTVGPPSPARAAPSGGGAAAPAPSPSASPGSVGSTSQAPK